MYDSFRKCLALLDRQGRREALWVALAIPVGSLLEVLSLAMILPLIALINAPEEIAENRVLATLHRLFGAPEATTFLIELSVGLVFIFACKNLLLAGILWLQNRFVFENEARLAQHLHRTYLDAPYTLHLDRNSAELIRNTDSAVAVSFSHMIMGFLELFAELAVAVTIGVLLIALEPVVAIGAAGLLGLLMGLFFVAFRRRHAALGAESMDLTRAVLASLHKSLGSVKEIQVLGRAGFFTREFAAIRERAARNRAVTAVFGHLPRLFMEFVMVTALLTVIMVILAQGRDIGDSISVLGLFAVAAFRLLPSANRTLAALHRIKYGRSALEEVYADRVSLPGPKSGPPVDGDPRTGDHLAAIPDLTLDKVTYTYPGAPRPSLTDIDLTVRAGDSVGLIGASGAGKTTLADILLGLLIPTGGRFLIGGAPAADRLAAWRRSVGYVPQSIYLADDSLRNNIAFGIAAGEIDDAAVARALGMARLDDLVAGLPDGLDTAIGEHGARLSGGQRQRIGIARALYHDPGVLVLDEATSALDNETEHEIATAIEGLRGRKTLIIIAHRLSTLRRCETLVFLRDGRAVDRGSFEALMARNADFRRLVELASVKPGGVIPGKKDPTDP